MDLGLRITELERENEYLKKQLKDEVDRNKSPLLSYWDIKARVEDGLDDFVTCSYYEDKIDSMADSFVDVYNSSLMNSAWELYCDGYIEQATDDMGETDFIRILSMAQFLYYGDKIREALDELDIDTLREENENEDDEE